MASKGLSLSKLGDELREFIEEVQTDVLLDRERALDKASDYLVNKLEQATPTDTGKTKKSWLRTTKYKAVRYVGSSALTTKNIPVVNLLEFSKNGKPFVRKTFDKNKEQIFNIIKEEFRK